MVTARLGAEILIVGAVLSTIKVAEAAVADVLFPAKSRAVFEVKLIPNVPSPVILFNVIVLVEVPLPLTVAVALAVPVLFITTCDEFKLTLLAPL